MRGTTVLRFPRKLLSWTPSLALCHWRRQRAVSRSHGGLQAAGKQLCFWEAQADSAQADCTSWQCTSWQCTSIAGNATEIDKARMFITVFTKGHHQDLFWASLIQSKLWAPISDRSVNWWCIRPVVILQYCNNCRRYLVLNLDVTCWQKDGQTWHIFETFCLNTLR
jgi:hypothetical protein